MVTDKDCIKKYGDPTDDATTTVNEQTVFEGKWMTLYNVPEAVGNVIKALPNLVPADQVSTYVQKVKELEDVFTMEINEKNYPDSD